MDDLIAFLNARYDAAEEIAKAADPGPWEVGPKFGGNDSMVYVREVEEAGIDTVGLTYRQSVFTSQVSNKTRFRENATFIAANDPARRLADIALKRAILADHSPVSESWAAPGGPWCGTCGDAEQYSGHPYPCATVRHLGTEYHDHPDYRHGWAP